MIMRTTLLAIAVSCSPLLWAVDEPFTVQPATSSHGQKILQRGLRLFVTKKVAVRRSSGDVSPEQLFVKTLQASADKNQLAFCVLKMGSPDLFYTVWVNDSVVPGDPNKVTNKDDLVGELKNSGYSVMKSFTEML